MARSTGPILAVGGITLFNSVIVHDKTMAENTRVIVGTGIAAASLALLEKLSPELAVGLAWLALVSILFVRVNPAVPSPVESFTKWYEGK